MAGRKNKNIIDYFPHKCKHGKTMYIIENKYGNDGYSVWFKTLELLGESENHYFDCRNEENWEYLQAKTKLMSTELNNIYDTFAKLNAIHRELWENKIIWSSNFIKNIEDVYKRRENKCMDFNNICEHLLIKCKHKYNAEGNIVGINTQSKVKESKVKETIKKKLVFYSEQIELNKEEGLLDKYILLVKYLFGENALGCPVEHILKLQNQLKFDEYKNLFKAAHAKNLSISELLDSWVNSPKYSKGKASIYLTLNNWINRSDGKNLKPRMEKRWGDTVKTGETLSLLEIINNMSNKKKGQKA